MKRKLNFKGVIKKILMTASIAYAIPLVLTANASASTGVLNMGSQGTAVTKLQQDLKNLGFYKYSLDGIFGRNTREAVMSLQRAKHITADGIVGSQTGKYLTSFSSMRSLMLTPRQASAIKTKKLSAKPSSVIGTATNLVGTPYRWGGTSTSGFDCSGYVRYVFQKHGMNLPRTSKEMYSNSTHVSSPNPGDLVFFNTNGPGPSHVGVYVGNGKFASATSHGVKVAELNNSYWGSHYLGVRRPNPKPLYA
jgi:cell wall-associated NlpC family hydrolase